jgi:hypothetical protein
LAKLRAVAEAARAQVAYWDNDAADDGDAMDAETALRTALRAVDEGKG